MDAERLLVDNLALIDDIVRATARRHRLRPDDAEELLSRVRLRLIANDYEALRAFAGRSSLRTYLTAIVQYVFLDHRNQRWGRWRPSIEACRLGPLAVRLETLTARDGMTLEEACAASPPEDRQALRALHRQLDPRPRRRTIEGEEALDQLAASDPSPEQVLVEAERTEQRARLAQSLRVALERLAPDDRLLVQLRVDGGLTMVEIARVLGREAKPLYRHYELVLRQLRRLLEDAGHEAGQVAWALDLNSGQTATVVSRSVPGRTIAP